MEWLDEFRRRLSVFFRRDRFDRDLEEEMQFHRETQAEEDQANGMPAEEARYAAQRRFGNTMQLKETSRDIWGWASVERLGQDLKYAIRMLRGDPAFTAVAVFSLA